MKTEQGETPTLGIAIKVWVKIGFLSFGGPAAQIALMHRILVDELKWIGEKQYLNALSFCMLLPGPEAMQLATYAGWRMHGIAGGLVAGLLFVLPGALVMLALAMIYAWFGHVSLVNALFLGIKAAVLIIVLEALMRVAGKALHGGIFRVIAGLAFIGIFFLALPFPLIIAVAAAIGFFMKRDNDDDQGAVITGVKFNIAKTAATIVLWLAIWFLPFLVIYAFYGENVLIEIGGFFARLAVVTFGGAYAVLAYMGQEVVSQFGWLSPGEMMDGLGLAETTPGPLILVTEFVGFLAAFREGGFWLGVGGAVVTLWMTFVPCFLWIFAGAPHIEWICSRPRLRGALSAISAAVVGVILNLSIWFALHVLFQSVSLHRLGLFHLWLPDFTTIDWRVVILALLSAVMILRYHWSILWVLLMASGVGGFMSLSGI